MWRFVVAERFDLEPGLYDKLLRYRHAVFVERLHWRLPTAGLGYEEDEFDTANTVYILALAPDGEVRGCGRLLSTTRPYLLGTVFPHLMEQAPPCSPLDWELSRFSAHAGAATTFGNGRLQRMIFRRAMHEVQLRGANRLIGVLSCAVERACRAFGANLVRLGSPVEYEGTRIVACATRVDLPLRDVSSPYARPTANVAELM